MTENVLSIFQCGFRKKYSTQHALIAKIEKTRKIPNKDGTFGALLTDLSKAFIVWHTTLEQNSMHWTLIWMHSTWYLINWQEGNKESKLTSVLAHIRYISRRSARFNFRAAIIQSILCDLFFIVGEADTMSYADNNTSYVYSENIDVTLEKLEGVGKVIFEWFSNNFLKANADKCYLILSANEPYSTNINNEVIKNSNSKKLLGINLNKRLCFDSHVTNIIMWPNNQEIVCFRENFTIYERS